MISNKINNFIDVPFPHKGQEWQSKRSELISDFITSERQYAQHLYHFINEYHVALEDAQKRNLINKIPQISTELFSKIQPIYNVTLILLQSVNECVLRSPNVAWEPAMARIGECFVRCDSRLTTAYSNYAVTFTDGMNALQKQFESEPNINLAISQCQENVGITIFECLQAPMNHISLYTDYLLMLLEVTPREHNDREDLVSSYITKLPLAKIFHSLLVKQDLLTLDKFNAQYPQFGLSNQCLGPRTSDTVTMNTSSSHSRYLIFHDDCVQCITGDSIIPSEIWLFSDCVMISLLKDENPVLFEFKNIKATTAELPSSFLSYISQFLEKDSNQLSGLENRRPSFINPENRRPSLINTENRRPSLINTENRHPSLINIENRRPSFTNAENRRPSAVSDNFSSKSIIQNLSETSSSNCADFFTNIDSFKLIFLMAKRRDVFIEACNNVQVNFKINGANSTADKDYPLAPVWVFENDVTDCMNCGRVFGIVTQSFHCDFCRQVFCKRCVTQIEDTKNTQRTFFICKKCKEKGYSSTLLPHMTVDYTSGGFYSSKVAQQDEKNSPEQTQK